MKCIVYFFTLLVVPHSAFSAMHGENNIWEAPDDLSCLPWTYDVVSGTCHQKVDAQLSNLIKRAGMTYAGNIQGSAFVIGEQCDKILSTKHTLHHLDGSKRGINTSVFFRNFYEKNQKINDKNRQEIRIENSQVEPLTELNDRKISQLHKSAIDEKLSSCPEVPLLPLRALKTVLNDIQMCIVLSFNQDIANPDLTKRSSMTMMSQHGLKRVNSRTRGITSCKIEGFAHDGMIETDCDTIYSASGSPFFCKVKNDKWKLVGVHVSDTCVGNDRYNKCLNPSVFGQKKVESLMLPLDQELIELMQRN